MLKVTPFEQTTGYCGPASLKMVLEYYGVKKSERELARLSGATIGRGVEGKGLLRAAKKLGLRGFIKDFASLSDIKKFVIQKKIPVIVDWFSRDDGHYSVVAGIDEKNIYLQDPEWGKLVKMDLKTFNRVWFDFPGNHIRSPRDLIIRRLIAIYK